MEFRNSYPAFNGTFNLLTSEDEELILRWTHKKYRATAHINLKTCKTTITYTDPVASQVVDFKV